jgi:hypothetical protein
MSPVHVRQNKEDNFYGFISRFSELFFIELKVPDLK